MPGQQVTFTLAVRNNGPSTASRRHRGRPAQRRRHRRQRDHDHRHLRRERRQRPVLRPGRPRPQRHRDRHRHGHPGPGLHRAAVQHRDASAPRRPTRPPPTTAPPSHGGTRAVGRRLGQQVDEPDRADPGQRDQLHHRRPQRRPVDGRRAWPSPTSSTPRSPRSRPPPTTARPARCRDSNALSCADRRRSPPAVP